VREDVLEPLSCCMSYLLPCSPSCQRRIGCGSGSWPRSSRAGRAPTDFRRSRSSDRVARPPGRSVAIAALAPADSALYGTLAAQLALLTGVILLACGALRVGFLSGFLSRPVLGGFTAGAAVLIAAGQLPLLVMDAQSHPSLHTANTRWRARWSSAGR
jgi:Sulfate permease family